MKRIALIGGGATNLLLASLLSKHQDIKIDIIEIRERVGKKILETGNGKCNFTNMNITKYDYNLEEFVSNIIDQNVLKTFSELGLLYYSDNEGRCYPSSDASNSILDLLRSTYLINENVSELVNSKVKKIEKENNGYYLFINNNKEYYDYVSIGIGSKVNNPKFKELNLNLNVNKYKPSLCPLNIDISGLKGVRVKCLMSLLDGDSNLYSEKGEVIFKDNAISGIAIFNASFYLNKYKVNNPFISLDLFPTLSENELINFLLNKPNKDVNSFFIGITNKSISQYLIKRLNLKDTLTIKDIKLIAYELKNLKFKVKGLVDTPQVAKGEININEVNSNLELKKYKNIYIGGECLDIDAKCGGYNLHFAFSSALTIYNDLVNKLCLK